MYNLLKELVELEKENNLLLKLIIQKLTNNEANDFTTNVIANLIANKIDNNERH